MNLGKAVFINLIKSHPFIKLLLRVTESWLCWSLTLHRYKLKAVLFWMKMCLKMFWGSEWESPRWRCGGGFFLNFFCPFPGNPLVTFTLKDYGVNMQGCFGKKCNSISILFTGTIDMAVSIFINRCCRNVRVWLFTTSNRWQTCCNSHCFALYLILYEMLH